MTLEEIKQAITTLSADELARLRVWLAQYKSGGADATGEPTTTATKLGRLAGRTFADIRKRLQENK